MRSFIKSHKKMGSAGKEDKIASPKEMPQKFLHKQPSFELLSTNKPLTNDSVFYHTGSRSPESPRVSPTMYAPKTFDSFPLETPSSVPSSPKIGHKSILKIPKKLLSRTSPQNVKETKKVLGDPFVEDDIDTGVRKNRVVIQETAITSQIAADDEFYFAKASVDSQHVMLDFDGVHKKPGYPHSDMTPNTSGSQVDLTNSTSSIENILNKRNRVSVINLSTDKRAMILERLQKFNDSKESVSSSGSRDSKFSFEQDLNGRNVSIKYYKNVTDTTNTSQVVDSETKVMYVDDFVPDEYGEEDFNEEVNFYDDTEADDTEHLFNRPLFSDDEDQMVKDTDEVLEEVLDDVGSTHTPKTNIEDISHNLNKMNLQVKTTEAPRVELCEDDVEDDPAADAEQLKVPEPKTVTETVTVTPTQKKPARYSWLDQKPIDAYYEKDTIDEYFGDDDDDFLEEVNGVPEDFDFDFEENSTFFQADPQHINPMFRSNSYSKKPRAGVEITVPQNNTFVTTSRKVTLFNSRPNSKESGESKNELEDLLSPITESSERAA